MDPVSPTGAASSIRAARQAGPVGLCAAGVPIGLNRAGQGELVS